MGVVLLAVLVVVRMIIVVEVDIRCLGETLDFAVGSTRLVSVLDYFRHGHGHIGYRLCMYSELLVYIETARSYMEKLERECWVDLWVMSRVASQS